MPVLLIIVIVLLVAVIFLIVRTASLGKRLHKLTQAFINERHKIAQITRYLNGDEGGFDNPLPRGENPQSRGQGTSARLENRVNPAGPARMGSPSGSAGGFNAVDAGGAGAVRPVGVGGAGAVRPVGAAQGHQSQWQPQMQPQRQPQRNPYHEEREKRNKKGFGRRNKPVIPFGADRTNEQRAARAAAAMIDDAPALSMDLSEPAAILKQQEAASRRANNAMPSARSPQMRVQGHFGDAADAEARAPHREMQGANMQGRADGFDRSRADMAHRQGMNDRAHADMRMRAEMQNKMNARRSVQRRDMSALQMPEQFRGQQPRRQVREGASDPAMMQQAHRFSGMEGGAVRPVGQARANSDGRMGVDDRVGADGRRIEPIQRRDSMSEQREASREERRSDKNVQADREPVRKVMDDPRVAQEKAAVSAAWIAEEERRMQERQARQAAQAKRAEKREQAQLRRQAEAIVQEHQRQTQGARANDTMRFD